MRNTPGKQENRLLKTLRQPRTIAFGSILAGLTACGQLAGGTASSPQQLTPVAAVAGTAAAPSGFSATLAVGWSGGNQHNGITIFQGSQVIVRYAGIEFPTWLASNAKGEIAVAGSRPVRVFAPPYATSAPVVAPVTAQAVTFASGNLYTLGASKAGATLSELRPPFSAKPARTLHLRLSTPLSILATGTGYLVVSSNVKSLVVSIATWAVTGTIVHGVFASQSAADRQGDIFIADGTRVLEYSAPQYSGPPAAIAMPGTNPSAGALAVGGDGTLFACDDESGTVDAFAYPYLTASQITQAYACVPGDTLALDKDANLYHDSIANLTSQHIVEYPAPYSGPGYSTFVSNFAQKGRLLTVVR